MMNKGKEKYDHIPIPEELDRVIWNSMRRAEKECRTKKIYKWVMGTAAAFCVMFCGANVNPIYTYAAQIPVLGVIVQVLHVGSGGERTDGVYTKTSLQGETVEIHFEGHSEK